MRTVYDLIRADAALEVVCRNCDHHAAISPLLLRDRLGLYGLLDDADWRCRRCGCTNAHVHIGAGAMAEPPARRYRRI